MRSNLLSLRALPVLGALAIALALGACGRKAGLDPPPGAAIERPATANSDRALDDQDTPNSRKRSPLDWLLD